MTRLTSYSKFGFRWVMVNSIEYVLFAKASMYDSSSIPNVDDLGLEQPGEIAYAAQMAARENALHAIFGPTDPPDHILSPGDPNLFINWSGGGIYQYPPHGKRKACIT